MIVPRTRLLAWVGLAVLPCATFAGVVPGTLAPVIALLTVLALVALVDAVLASRSVEGLRVELPELVRLQNQRPGTMHVRVLNESRLARVVRLGFAFAPQVGADDFQRLVELPADVAASRVEWPCQPTERGCFFLDRVYLEGSSPLGFWAFRRSAPVRSELRVYPNLFDERKNVAALFLRRAAPGAQARRQVGQGREFEKLRDYVHGDPLGDIHWKASAKRGHPVTKIFQVERTQEVYVIVDASRLTARAVPGESGETFVLERFVTAALILGLAAEQQGDQFGLVTFSDKVLSFVRAKNGQAHYDACRDRLYTLQPQAVTPDFDELCSFIRLKLRKRALLIFLTALDDPMLAESFEKSVQLISRQHLVIVDMLQPPGAEPVFGEREVSKLGEIYERLGGHLHWHQLRELQKVLQRRGVRLSLLDPMKLPAQVVAQHANVKARQLL